MNGIAIQALALGFLALLFQSPTIDSARRTQRVLVDQVQDFSSESQFTRRKKKKRRRRACRDRKDNDGDGLIDYPEDPGCKSKRDRKEKNPPLPSGEGYGAGVSLNGLRPFPDNNPWNQDISQSPVDSNSANLIASIGLDTGLHPDFGTVWQGVPNGIPYIVVSGSQPRVPVSFDYADESDPGPYPIPANAPIEGGEDSDGDRHVLVVDRDNWKLYEMFYSFRSSGGWTAGSGAVFDLSSNTLRPAGWTSADAAGLPIFPGLVRYDEVMEQKEIRHALRFTASTTRRAYVPPATHFASNNTDSNLPPMGMRVRLKASFDVSSHPLSVQVILRALQKYGMFLADNGSNWFVSGAPDSRWNDEDLATLRQVKGSDFEVIEMSQIVTD